MNKRFLFILGFFGILATTGVIWVLNKRGRDNQPGMADQALRARKEVEAKMKVTSSAFKNNDKIPARHTCEGKDINPPLSIGKAPEGTRSLVLIVDDPDAPTGTWDHWLVFNIEPTVREIAEDSIPDGGVEITNSFGKTRYGGPCPPPGPPHRYFFKVFALDGRLDPRAVSDKAGLLTAMKGRILASGELIGTYSRSE